MKYYLLTYIDVEEEEKSIWFETLEELSEYIEENKGKTVYTWG